LEDDPPPTIDDLRTQEDAIDSEPGIENERIQRLSKAIAAKVVTPLNEERVRLSTRIQKSSFQIPENWKVS
jgi:hypothetical protein